MRVFVPGNFISSYQVAEKEMAVNWMSYLEKLSKRKRDMVNRWLEDKGFFLLGLQEHRQVNMTESYVSIHEPTFLLPWELAVMAWETCSTVVAKWQIVSSVRHWGNDDRSWIPIEQELVIAAICHWLRIAWDRKQNLPVYFFCVFITVHREYCMVAQTSEKFRHAIRSCGKHSNTSNYSKNILEP